MFYTLAQHECRLLYKNGKLFHLLALCQSLLGFIFCWLLKEFYANHQRSFLEQNALPDITEGVLHPLFAWTALLFFFITPLLAAHTLTQERKSHILTLYLSSSLSSFQLIIGKFFGTWFLQCILLLPIFCMSFLVSFDHTLDIGQLTSSYFGLILFLGSTLSLSFLVASCCLEPLMAVFLSFMILVVLSALEWIDRAFHFSTDYFSHLSLLYHCKNFLSGLMHSQDIIYYVFLMVVCLSLSVLRLEKESYFQ